MAIPEAPALAAGDFQHGRGGRFSGAVDDFPALQGFQGWKDPHRYGEYPLVNRQKTMGKPWKTIENCDLYGKSHKINIFNEKSSLFL